MRTHEAAPDSAPMSFYAWYVVALLMVVNVMASMDRVIPYVIAPMIVRDLRLSDTQVGAIGSLTFTLVYSLVGLCMGYLADRAPRKLLLAFAALGWSAFTALGGFAQNFLQLSGSRFGLAVGESVLQPSATSLIADLAPPRHRRLALSVFLAGASLGVILGMAGAGMLAERVGWRQTLMLFALPGGVTFLLLLLTIREPPRATPAASIAPKDVPSLGAVLRAMAASPVLLHLIASAILFFMMGAALHAFAPLFFVRRYDVSAGAAGLATGLILGGAGALGMLLSGVLTDRLGRIDKRWAAWVPAVALAVATPFLLATWSAPTAFAAMAFLTPPAFLITMFVPAVVALVLEQVDQRARGQAVAVLSLAMYGVGASSGGVLAGMLSDRLQPIFGAGSIRVALSAMTLLYLWSAAHLWLAGKRLQPPS